MREPAVEKPGSSRQTAESRNESCRGRHELRAERNAGRPEARRPRGTRAPPPTTGRGSSLHVGVGSEPALTGLPSSSSFVVCLQHVIFIFFLIFNSFTEMQSTEPYALSA